MDKNSIYTRSSLAQCAGISVETLRYYENIGLLGRVERNTLGYRIYDAAMISHIQYIRNTRELGFSLEEIREIMELQNKDSEDCRDIRSQFTAKIAEIDQKIAELMTIRNSLENVVASCDGNDPARACPIIRQLHGEECQACLVEGKNNE